MSTTLLEKYEHTFRHSGNQVKSHAAISVGLAKITLYFYLMSILGNVSVGISSQSNSPHTYMYVSTLA